MLATALPTYKTMNGKVPKKMNAQVIRPERFGDPRTAFQIEEIEIPEIKPNEVLIGVMAAGINYNNIWAARGIPINVIAVRQKVGELTYPHGGYDFHIGGSDVSGIVYIVQAFFIPTCQGDIKDV